MRKIIAIDIDDVLADSTDAFRLVVNEKTGANLQPEDYMVEAEYWNYYETVWEANDLHIDMHALGDEQMRLDQSHIALVAGAEYAISNLLDRFDIIFVTSRKETWRGATEAWLKKHFKNTNIEVHFADYDKRHEKKSKGEMCKELGASWLIDDNPEHCMSAFEHGVEPVLFGQYGWQFSLPQGLRRCLDWPSVLEYFNGE